MWVQFKQKWQDGHYKYQVGMVVELPRPLAEGYCLSGKAKPCKPPKWAVEKEKEAKAKVYPSARRRIKKTVSRMGALPNLNELADSIMEDED